MSLWLLLEDEKDIKNMILATFEVLGATGLSFADGESALAWINEVEKGTYTGELPELALLDVRMPTQINGPEVAARLRRCPPLKDIIIVLITAYRLNPNEQQALMAYAGADFMLYKPLPTIEELEYIFHGLLLRR